MRCKITNQDVHYTKQFYRRFVSSLSEPIESITICSPYFDKLPKPFDNVIVFCRHLQSRGVENISIITRPPGVDATALDRDSAKTLAGMGIDLFIRAAPYLHAKIYRIQYSKGHFRSFVGSSNFTLGGMERNHELVAELEGFGPNSPCLREVSRLTGRGALSYTQWAGSNFPDSVEEVV